MYKNNIYNAINMSIYSNTCLSIEREQKIRMTVLLQYRDL